MSQNGPHDARIIRIMGIVSQQNFLSRPRFQADLRAPVMKTLVPSAKSERSFTHPHPRNTVMIITQLARHTTTTTVLLLAHRMFAFGQGRRAGRQHKTPPTLSRPRLGSGELQLKSQVGHLLPLKCNHIPVTLLRLLLGPLWWRHAFSHERGTIRQNHQKKNANSANDSSSSSSSRQWSK